MTALEQTHIVRGSARVGRLGKILTLVGVMILVLNPRPGYAQWTILNRSSTVVDQFTVPQSTDSSAAVLKRALAILQRNGYLTARIDSFKVDRMEIHATLGERAQVAAVHLAGMTALDSTASLRTIALRSGSPLTAVALESSVQSLIDSYVAAGFHQVSVSIEALELRKPMRVNVRIAIDEGIRPLVGRIDLAGSRRTGARLARRVSGIRIQTPLIDFDAEALQSQLEGSGIFTDVGLPKLYLDADNSLVVHIPVVESPPGAFDLALGYERAESGRGALVGSGRLALRNLFGGGRTLTLQLHRAPGQVSKIDVRADDPFLLGLPLALAVGFNGLQQDSTYGKRTYGLEAGYWIDQSMQIYASAGREVTRPGLGGLALVRDQQRIASSTAVFVGGGVRLNQTNHSVSPTRGYYLTMSVERGAKETTATVVREQPVREVGTVRQVRLRVGGRAYVGVSARQVLAVGGEIRMLRARVSDESDWFRFGGASSLRGYDEDRFRAPFVARALAEYRYLLDRTSYGFLFADLGYVDATATPEGNRGLYPGFGVGLQVDTAAGVINLTFACSTEDLSAVRAHIGLSLGL